MSNYNDWKDTQDPAQLRDALRHIYTLLHDTVKANKIKIHKDENPAIAIGRHLLKVEEMVDKSLSNQLTTTGKALEKEIKKIPTGSITFKNTENIKTAKFAPMCKSTFEMANGETVSPCYLVKGHEGDCKGTLLGSACTWPQGVSSEYEMHMKESTQEKMDRFVKNPEAFVEKADAERAELDSRTITVRLPKAGEPEGNGNVFTQEALDGMLTSFKERPVAFSMGTLSGREIRTMVEADPADLKFLRDLLTEMTHQDNRSTALPYYYVIRDYKMLPTPEGFSDKYTWYSVEQGDEGPDSDSSDEEFLEHIEDHEDWPEFSKVRGSDRDNMEDFIERIGYERIWQQEVEVYKNCFLTETAAKQHLQSNRHHYGPKAATYVHHFWRNPEVEKLFEAVGRMTGVPYELQYKREREDDKS